MGVTDGGDSTYVIPTRTKWKIAQTLSWPVGAEDVSQALKSVSQLSELVLHFRAYRAHEMKRRNGIYEVIRVSYMGTTKTVNPVSAEGIALFNRWEIVVNPVPRNLRHKVHEHILSSALPAVRDWLHERPNLELEGAEHLRFFYNEKSDRFSSEADGRLQPLRKRL